MERGVAAWELMDQPMSQDNNYLYRYIAPSELVIQMKASELLNTETLWITNSLHYEISFSWLKK